MPTPVITRATNIQSALGTTAVKRDPSEAMST